MLKVGFNLLLEMHLYHIHTLKMLQRCPTRYCLVVMLCRMTMVNDSLHPSILVQF